VRIYIYIYIYIYVWYVLYFAHAVADVTDAAGSSLSGFSSRFLLFVFAYYYVLLVYINFKFS
jgi:hypothetical protein